MLRIGLIFLMIFFIKIDWVMSQQLIQFKRYNISDIYAIEKNLCNRIIENFAVDQELEPMTDVDVAETLDRIHELYVKVINSHRDAEKILELKNIINLNINPLYEKFLNFMDGKINENEMKNVTESMKSTLNERSHQIQMLIYSGEVMNTKKNIWFDIAEKTANYFKTNCNSVTSTQIELFKFIKIIARVLIRIKIMSTYVDDRRQTLLDVHDIGNILTEMINPSWYRDFKEIFLSVTTAAPKVICIRNPEHHETPKTFVELKKPFSYERVSKEKIKNRNCEEKCKTEWIESSINYSDCFAKSEICTEDLSRKIYNDLGNYMSHPLTMFIPPSNNNTIGLSPYNLISNIGNPAGMSSEFHRNIVNSCSNCECYCTPTRDQEAIQVISMLDGKSDIENNMVVTGIKFELKNNIVHLKIKEGELLPLGNIRKSSELWKTLPKIERQIDGYYYSDIFKLFPEIHYTVISDKNRIMGLRDVMVPPGHVVTGVRFGHEKESDDKKYYPLSLEVRVTAFDFKTGELDKTGRSDKWINSAWIKEQDEKIRTTKKNNISFFTDNTINPENTYSIFTEVFPHGKRTIVPFFDVQPVETNPGFALGGIGLALKSARFTNGYLTMKIFPLDISQYIK